MSPGHKPRIPGKTQGEPPMDDRSPFRQDADASWALRKATAELNRSADRGRLISQSTFRRLYQRLLADRSTRRVRPSPRRIPDAYRPPQPRVADVAVFCLQMAPPSAGADEGLPPDVRPAERSADVASVYHSVHQRYRQQTLGTDTPPPR